MTEQMALRWIAQYGYLGIFFLLIFGIVGLPVPDEWLLVLSGYLVFKPAKNNGQPADVINGPHQTSSGDAKTPATNPDKLPDTAKNSKPSPDVRK